MRRDPSLRLETGEGHGAGPPESLAQSPAKGPCPEAGQSSTADPGASHGAPALLQGWRNIYVVAVCDFVLLLNFKLWP